MALNYCKYLSKDAIKPQEVMKYFRFSIEVVCVCNLIYPHCVVYLNYFLVKLMIEGKQIEVEVWYQELIEILNFFMLKGY